MSTDPTFRREDHGSKGRYVLTQNGAEAEITFSVTTPTLIIADHTGVPDALRGIKIVPLCPFVNSQRRKHPDWADAFAA